MMTDGVRSQVGRREEEETDTQTVRQTNREGKRGIQRRKREWCGAPIG